jgi:hypothetical protein
MRARTLAIAAAIAASIVSFDRGWAQPQRSTDPQATIAAVRSYFEQELPIGWRVREVQLAQGGQGANVYLDAPFWTFGDMNAEAREACPGTEAFLWRSILFVAISVTRRGFGGTGSARCSAMGQRQ